jgi:hypothetical protein
VVAEGEDRTGRIPVSWPQRWGPSRRSRPLFIVIGGAATALVFAAMIPAAAREGAAVLAPVSLVVLGAGASLLGLRQPFGKKAPEFVDSVALTNAESMPPDSWVHFIRQRRAGLLTTLALWSFAVVPAVLVVAAILIGTSGRPQALLGLVIALPAAVVMVWTAVHQSIAEFRLGSFGRRPVGLTIGRSGIAMIRVGDPLYVPWGSVVSVTALLMGGHRRYTPPLPLIEVRLRGEETEVLTLTPAGTDVHPWVVLAALSHYLDHPADRAELGTTFGQRRLERWSAAIS